MGWTGLASVLKLDCCEWIARSAARGGVGNVGELCWWVACVLWLIGCIEPCSARWMMLGMLRAGGLGWMVESIDGDVRWV
jgi:hypothetical protein